MKIERLNPSEGMRFRVIRLRSLKDAPDAFGSTYEETAARPEQSWSEQVAKMPTFVAVVDGRDVGVVRGAADEESRDAAWLLSMWVAPEARGTGVGEALIDTLIGWARGCGYARISLDVADGNRHAVSLYERMGFKPNGEVGALPPPREHVREHRRVLQLLAD
jgi:GNAT superfamily N-acetyltransferase